VRIKCKLCFGMIHELLLALNGCEGNIFTLNNDTGMIEVRCYDSMSSRPFVFGVEVKIEEIHPALRTKSGRETYCPSLLSYAL